jgi:alpha-ribazole phosphatase
MGIVRCLDIYLVRHGLTLWNREERYVGHTDVPCLPEQLSAFDRLRERFLLIRWHAVYSSDLSRCRETVSYLLGKRKGQVRVRYDLRLRELHFGRWEGKTYNTLKDLTAYRRWLEDWMHQKPPGGESGVDFQTLVDAALADILEAVPEPDALPVHTPAPASYHDTNRDPHIPAILIVTHGGVIRHLLHRWVSGRPFWQGEIAHGRAYRLRFSTDQSLRTGRTRRTDHTINTDQKISSDQTANTGEAGGGWTCYSLQEEPMPEKEPSSEK